MLWQANEVEGLFSWGGLAWRPGLELSWAKLSWIGCLFGGLLVCVWIKVGGKIFKRRCKIQTQNICTTAVLLYTSLASGHSVDIRFQKKRKEFISISEEAVFSSVCFLLNSKKNRSRSALIFLFFYLIFLLWLFGKLSSAVTVREIGLKAAATAPAKLELSSSSGFSQPQLKNLVLNVKLD